MTILKEKIIVWEYEADLVWGKTYKLFDKVINDFKLQIGAEIGVAFGVHSASILKLPTVKRLYGVDPYLQLSNFHNALNLSQQEFNQLYHFTASKLAKFGDRYHHIRKTYQQAVDEIPIQLDFVYIDSVYSYGGTWENLCTWYCKVRDGGIIGGNYNAHSNFETEKININKFFSRFSLNINEEGEGVWWVEKKKLQISFIIPAYNCAKTIEESVASIFDKNIEDGDEIVIVNDGSTDNTKSILSDLKNKYPEIKLVDHKFNKGGGAARNTAIENTQHSIIFCLDSDNILETVFVRKLKEFLVNSGMDIAAFQELYYFSKSIGIVTHKWKFKEGITSFADYMSGPLVPGASGNYMFTKESWIRAGRYPEFTFLDTWGFGFRQMATNSKMAVLPKSYYYHRYGHESYWVREAKKGKVSLTALQVIIPFMDLLSSKDVDYIMSKKGRAKWFENLQNHPIHLHDGSTGISGRLINEENSNRSIISICKKIFNKLNHPRLKAREL